MNHFSRTCRAWRFVVFVEQHSRGWHATVDGKEVPIARANLVMRALALGPGSHRIEIDYRTPGLAAGLALSGLCALVLLGLLLLPSRLGRRQSAGPVREF